MKSLLSLLLFFFAAAAYDLALASDDAVRSWPLNMPATNLLLIGEIHGTNEAPALVGNLACSSAKTGNNLVVALEIPVHEQASLDQFLMSGGTDADQTALLTGRFGTRQA
ncbi:hypothetical protein [Stenotrophomonas sp.]|uniref:hypothetical protein n=1 Tax=Stenotrophomonas sp. TaxID=69392 RepID=UPI0028AF0C98|nr:hypothetical protein [Stenotrophomonas sp.]